MDFSDNYMSRISGLLNLSVVEPRAYQINIARSISTGKNTLVVLPTGMGKTLIAVFAIAEALNSGKKALILSPTKPLSQQHYDSLTKFLNVDKEIVLLLTGSIGAKKRAALEEASKIITATPQTVANDLKAGRLTLAEFGIVIFDECHRAAGKYAYTYISDQCKEMGIQMLGLTASPGSDRKKIDLLISTLGITNIQVKVTTDPDVAPYVMGKDTHVYFVDKGEMIDQILSFLKPVIDEHLSNLYHRGLSPFRSFENLPKGRLLQIGDAIGKLQAEKYKFMALFNYVYVLNLAHAYDMIATEGVGPFLDYMAGLEGREKKSRAVASMLKNESVLQAIRLAKEMQANGQEHPKMSEVLAIISNGFINKTVIVFAQYRSTIKQLTKMLKGNGLKVQSFTGKGESFSQAEQKQAVDDFRAGKFNVLVSTSIGEEGLDIPSVDCVIFYEPVPSAIRNIQRRGRAGRMKFGNVVILVTKGTKDEAYHMVSKMREKRMKEILDRIKVELETGHSPARRRALGVGQQNFIADWMAPKRPPQ